MITINVLLTVKPEQTTQYLELIDLLVTESNKEDGCAFYAHFESTSTANTFCIIENWESQAAIEAHNQTPHFQKFSSNIKTYVSEDVQIKSSFSK